MDIFYEYNPRQYIKTSFSYFTADLALLLTFDSSSHEKFHSKFLKKDLVCTPTKPFMSNVNFHSMHQKKTSKSWEVFKSEITDICIEDKLIVVHK